MQLITTSSIEKHRDVYVRTEELASYISESATTYDAPQVNSLAAKSPNQLQLNLMRAT